MASLAALTGHPDPERQAYDSHNNLHVLNG